MASVSSVSPSPSPAATTTQQHLNSIMRPIQSHVRVLGYPEYFHFSRDRVLTLSSVRANNTTKGANDSNEGTTTTDAALGGSATDASVDPLDKRNIVCEAKIANVHRYGQSIDDFFEAVVAPCIESAMSGQSFVFLVTGPASSGRSQTVYGDNKKMKGLVELTAERLLQQIGDGDYISRKNNGGGSVSPPSALMGAASQSSPFSPAVTYSAYGCTGNTVFETNMPGEPPVELKEFPSPLGLIPLPKMNLLEVPRHAVCIPKSKVESASYFTQFQIVKPMTFGSGNGNDNSSALMGMNVASSPSSAAAQAAAAANARRCSQATLTFVDLAAMVNVDKETFSPDLAALVRAVKSASTGADPQFGSCALTRLLESAIVGSTTMVAIGTVTGMPKFFTDTAATLKFVESFGNINQVLTLVNIIVPPWLKTAYEEFRSAEAENDNALTGAYEKGCYDAYAAVTNILCSEEARVRKESAVFDGISAKVAELRSATYKTVQEENAKVGALVAAEKAEADAAELHLVKDPLYLKNQQFVNNCEEDVRKHESHMTQIRADTEAEILNYKNKIASINERSAKRERELNGDEEQERQLKKTIAQRTAAFTRRAADVSIALQVDSQLQWILQKQAEIQELDRYVTAGSVRARDATNAERTDRELRAKLMKITQLERQLAEAKERAELQPSTARAVGYDVRSVTPPTVRGPVGGARQAPSISATNKYTSSTTKAVAGATGVVRSSISPASGSNVSPSTSRSPATKSSPTSTLSKALTNTVVSVQSIFGGRFGKSAPSSSSESNAKKLVVSGDSRLSNQNGNFFSSGNGSVRITNVLANTNASTQFATNNNSSRSALAPASSAKVNQSSVTNVAATIKAHQAKILIPTSCDETDDATGDTYTTTFIASP